MHSVTATRSPYILPLCICIGINLVIGFTASLFTRPEIAGWYSALQKPPFNPPNSVFAPVWTILYILIGVAAFLVWRQRKHPLYTRARNWYFVQLIFNFSWSMVFFGLHSITGGLVIILILLASIITTLILFGRINRVAMFLFIPYLLWVSFATVLNLSILLLN